MQADDFDPSAYLSVPQLDVPSQLALCRQLLALAPDELPPAAQTCKRRLLEATRTLADGYKVTQSDDPALSKRPIDLAADNAWACVKARLEPYTWLDEDQFPEAETAQVLLRKLFPGGLAFTQLEYGAQWAEASWRIKILSEQKLEPELRRLCGDLFVDELLRCHKEYEKMAGVASIRRGRTEGARRPNLADLRRQAVQAVIAWQAQLVALHLAGQLDARMSLSPTDEYREKIAAGRTAEPRSPSAPPPPSPPEPVPA